MSAQRPEFTFKDFDAENGDLKPFIDANKNKRS